MLVDEGLDGAWPQFTASAKAANWELLELARYQGAEAGLPRVVSDRAGGGLLDLVERLRAQSMSAPLYVALGRGSPCVRMIPRLAIVGVDDVFFATKREAERAVVELDRQWRVLAACSEDVGASPPPTLTPNSGQQMDEVVRALLDRIARQRGVRVRGVVVADRMHTTVRTLNRHLHDADLRPLGELLRSSTVSHAEWMHKERCLSWVEVADLLRCRSAEALSMLRARVHDNHNRSSTSKDDES